MHRWFVHIETVLPFPKTTTACCFNQKARPLLNLKPWPQLWLQRSGARLPFAGRTGPSAMVRRGGFGALGLARGWFVPMLTESPLKLKSSMYGTTHKDRGGE